MGTTATLQDLIRVAPSVFDAVQAEYLVATKTDRDAAGNLRTAYPSSAIVSRLTAGWGNRVDDLLRALVAAGRGETLIGTVATPEADPAALLTYNVAAARVLLLNAAASAYQSLQVATLHLQNGARLIDGTGTPEGSVTAGLGSIYTDIAIGGIVYRKNTASGNTGWVAVSGAQIHREAFGFDSSTTTAEVYASFTSSVVEQNVNGSPRAPNVWRAPITGTITAVTMAHETNTTSVSAQVYETDGSTTRGAAATDAPSTFTLGAGTGYLTELAMSVAVTAGDLICLGLDGTGPIGEANCWLEVTPS